MDQAPPARSEALPEIDITQLEPMARAQEAAGNLQAAAAAWQRLIELWPQDDRMIAEFGSFHLRRGNFTEALAWYTQALALSDSNRGAHFGVSIALRAVGKLDDAILSVRRAIALNPGIGDYHSNLGHMLVSAGRSLEAIAAFEQAIALEPQNAGLHQALAALQLRDGDLETTIEQARAALLPDVASTHLRLGQLLIRGNRYVEAASALEQAVLIEPANVALRLVLADVYNELGRFESAVFELRQALPTAPDRADIRLALSRLLERMGEIAAAAAVAADGPANDVLHSQRRRLHDIEAGHRHAIVPLRYVDATFEVLLGGEAITTTSPLVHTNLGDFDADFARHHAEVLYVARQRRCPAVRLYRLPPDARLIVSGDEDFTVVQGHRVVAEQVRPTTADARIEPAVTGPNRHDRFTGDCVLIGRYGICTWGHWLGELLPKIVAVECRHPGRFRYIVPRVLVGNPVYRTALQSLHYYGVDTSRLAIALPDTSYAADALYLVSPVWSPDRMVHPAAMESMRRAGPQSGDPAPATHRIALLRRGDGRRGIANIAEVEAFFTACGWSVVDVEERTFQDQVALFRSAEAIACVLGSGLTGLIYAPLGVKVLILAPDKWSDLFFTALMQERGAHLADIRGRSLGANAAEAATAKFEVEIPAIEAGLAALGLAHPSTVPAIHRCLGNDHSLADIPIVVTIEPEAANMGDTINTIPFLLALARQYGRPVHVQGRFNAAVKDLVTDLPISFDKITEFGPRLDYRLEVRACWDHVGPKGLHMAQGYFDLAGMVLPDLPITIPFKTEPCHLPPGIVISPFCGGEKQLSDDHVRVWYADRWNAVIEALQRADPIRPIYIIGGPNDDPAPFLRDGVIPLIGLKLPQIVDLMQQSKLCITIDTGTSHLAHYGGVAHHVLLYPERNHFHIHANPRAATIRANPVDISVAMVLDKVRERVRP